MSNLSLREIAQSQLDSTPVIDGQLIVCLDTGNAYRDTATAHVKIGSDLEVVNDLPLAPLAEKIYYLKPDKLYVFLGGNWTLLNDKTIDLDESIAKLPVGSSTVLNDDVEIITQDTDITQSHYYRRKLVVLWEYIKTKAQDFFAAKNHQHGKADITDFPTSMPASDVYPWAKAATKPSYTKAEIGLGKVDNTADADKTVKRATTAGTADSANSVAWGNVRDKPTTFPVEAHNHDDRYYTEAEVNSKLSGKVDNTEAGANGLINKLSTADGIPNDATVFISQHNDGKTASYYRRPISTLWTYIKSKADSVYQPKGSYAASNHSHDDRYYTEAEMDGRLNSKVDNNEAGANGLLSKLSVWTATPTDDTYFMRQDTDGTNQFGRVKFSTIWNYIRGKADSVYLKLSGGTMSGQIIKSTGGSWIGDRDRAAIRSGYAGDWSYGAVAAMATKNGYWTIGNLGGEERLIFNYSTDSNYSAGKNETSQVYLPAQAGTIITSATIRDQTVNTATYSTYVKDIGNSSNTTFAYSKNGMSYGDYTWLAGWNGYELRAVNKSQFAIAGHSHSFINSVGVKNAQTGRNQTYGDVYSYNSNASAHTGMPTTYTSTIGFGQGAAGTVEICGEWTGGKGLWSRALRDWQDNWYDWQRIYTDNYHPSADVANKANSADYLNFTAGNKINFTGTPTNNTVYFGYRNSTINDYRFCNGSGGLTKVTAAAFNGKATSAGTADSATTAAKLGRNGNTGAPMTFNWNGQGGQPTWLWGSNDGSNIYVWNPSNFSVNYASSSGYANSAGSAPANGGTATNAEYISNESRYMRFHWSGQSGQPTWLWGGNDASNMYVWNPSNFSVNYANSAGNGVTASGKTGAGIYYVRFGNGTQMCWGFYKESDHSGSTSFPVAFNNSQYSISLAVTVSSNNAPYITGRSTTSFSYARHGTSYNDVQWIAVGTWK